jgi:hypothetical protein
MATHRRPPVSVMPPPELFVYNPADWVSLEAWCAARREWVKTHGRDTPLGSMLDVCVVTALPAKSYTAGSIEWRVIAGWLRVHRLNYSSFALMIGCLMFRRIGLG